MSRIDRALYEFEIAVCAWHAPTQTRRLPCPRCGGELTRQNLACLACGWEWPLDVPMPHTAV